MFTETPVIFPDSLVSSAFWLNLIGLVAQVHLNAIDE